MIRIYDPTGSRGTESTRWRPRWTGERGNALLQTPRPTVGGGGGGAGFGGVGGRAVHLPILDRWRNGITRHGRHAMEAQAGEGEKGDSEYNHFCPLLPLSLSLSPFLFLSFSKFPFNFPITRFLSRQGVRIVSFSSHCLISFETKWQSSCLDNSPPKRVRQRCCYHDTLVLSDSLLCRSLTCRTPPACPFGNPVPHSESAAPFERCQLCHPLLLPRFLLGGHY